MGQKVNPRGMRVGIIKGWDSQWFANKKDFSAFILEDNNIRKMLKSKYKNCGISKIVIERNAGKVSINLHTSRPGMVIGQKGAGVESMKKEVAKLTDGKPVSINVIEIRIPDADAQLVAENIASQLDQRVGFRRAMKQAITRSMKTGVLGIKTMIGGRLDGADIARSEFYLEGNLPLQTLRADIDYGFAEASIYGKLGVKVWIFKGEILGKVNLTDSKGGDKHVNA